MLVQCLEVKIMHYNQIGYGYQLVIMVDQVLLEFHHFHLKDHLVKKNLLVKVKIQNLNKVKEWILN